MSTLTRCNRCNLDRMERRAAQRGATVILDKTDDGWISARYSDHEKPSAWFMELTDGCVC